MYLVFWTSGPLLLILNNKTEKEYFKKQRDISNFKIIKIKNTKIYPISFEINYNLSINFYGYLISASEEEFLCEGIGQMITEIDDAVRKLISFIDVLNFTDQEREIVDEYLFYLYQSVKIYLGEYSECFYDNFKEVFDINKLMKDFLKFNGCGLDEPLPII